MAGTIKKKINAAWRKKELNKTIDEILNRL
jgi:hypothetical protein